jgi:hypothetical protein
MRHETERADRGPCDLGPHVCEVLTDPALAVHVGLLRFDYASMLAAVWSDALRVCGRSLAVAAAPRPRPVRLICHKQRVHRSRPRRRVHIENTQIDA